ncbi:hypothetical protein IE53DRAFT_368093 [Violaceomyces palustris]|uniref:Uncharacterized protein n=1 Tax=Violaceomyces palustris TaxID=1673888 RepID=A0ACD0P008_9BASI|nr:hypothetical protein IE53DRAFT_368093 [Violaceomyces palustris]
MDYFKSLSSAASSVLSAAKSGPLPNFNLGQEVFEFRSTTIWSLYNATKKEDGSQCSVLAFDLSHPHNSNRSNLLPLAKNSLRKLRTTRHPNVVKLLDSAETPTSIYIAVEQVTPLTKAMAVPFDQRASQQRQDWITWGLSSIANAVKFLNNDTASTHGNLRPDSIFLSSSGEWKLAGFETLTPSAEGANGILFTHSSLLPDATRYAPPEVKQNGWSILHSMDSTLVDSYAFALLAIEAYNGTLPPSVTNAPPPRGHTPQQIYAMLQRMLVPNAKNRLTVAKLADAGEAEGGFFKENTLVKVARGLDGFLLSSENEKAVVLRILKESPDSFPPEFLQHKVLPSLVSALNTIPPPGTIPSSSTSATTLLPIVLRLGEPLPKQEWTTSIVLPLLKAYTSTDRSTRMALLENLPLYADRLEQKTVTDKIWPNLLTGFNDSVPIIREATLKAILPLAPKLNDRILNNDLLRQLAKTQVDPEAGIRTNTTILLGRLAPHISVSTRKKVLIPAFSRSLKDAFVHARVAGLMALMATSESFDHEDSARQVLPAVAPCLVDKEKLVRDQASKAMAMFLKTVEEGVKSMPDTMLTPEQLSGEATGAGAGQPGSLASSAGGAAAALAGWAMSSALSQLGGQNSSPNKGAGSVDSAAPELKSQSDFKVDLMSLDTVSPKVSSSPSPHPPLGRASLSPSDTNTSSSRSLNDWGNMYEDFHEATTEPEKDLMDVHDDAGDWSSFEVGQPKKTPRSRLGAASSRGGKRVPKTVASAGSKLAAAKVVPKRSAITLSVPDPERSVARSSLLVVQSSADDEGDAWGNPWDEGTAENGDGNGNTGGSAMSTPTTDVASQEITAMAFQAWAPASRTVSNSGKGITPGEHQEDDKWDDLEGTSGAADAEDGAAPRDSDTPLTAGADVWASLDEVEASSDTPPDSKPSTPAVEVVAMTKEEKRAEIERKRIERRNRMAALKEEREKERLRAAGLA